MTTTIGLFVREKDALNTRNILLKTHPEFHEYEWSGDLVQFDIPNRPSFLVDDLQLSLIIAGIPLDYVWYGCENFSAGNGSARFNADGTVLVKYMHVDHIAMIDGNDILSQIKSGGFVLLEFITMLQNRVEHHTNPGWDNQDEYAQIYLSHPLELRHIRYEY